MCAAPKSVAESCRLSEGCGHRRAIAAGRVGRSWPIASVRCDAAKCPELGAKQKCAVERLRVEAARRLLSESRLPVKRISQRCGFGSEETMRRSFLRVLSATPNDYRARFSS